MGDIERLQESARRQLQSAIDATATNSELILNLALSYGARDELTQATRKLAALCVKGTIRPDEITADHIEQQLYTAGLPDPDLLIRTGGESRLSNFLLWQASYSEIYFTDVMWPDFRREQYIQAIYDYQQRERRFGKTSAQLVGR